MYVVVPTLLFSGQTIVRNTLNVVRSDGKIAEVFPGLNINVIRFKVAPNGDFYIFGSLPAANPSTASQFFSGEIAIFHLTPSLPGPAGGGYFVPSSSGSEIYAFDTTGRHLSTLDGLTSAPKKYTFAYDSNGFVSSVTDRSGLVTSISRDASGNPTGISSPTGQTTTLNTGPDGYLASVVSPGGAQYQFEYSNGLLTQEVDPRSGLHQFTYDASGRLTQDQNPIGGGWTISGQGLTGDRTVSMVSGQGRTETYSTLSSLYADLTNSPSINGARNLTAVHPDGLQSVVHEDSQGGKQIISPDGTVTTTTMAADPRFGMAAPFVATRTETTPGGLTSSVSTSRTASVATDGVTLVSEAEAATINGLTATMSYDSSTRTTTGISPAGRQGMLTQDDHGRTTLIQRGTRAPTAIAYDSRGRISTVTVGTGASARVSTVSYDANDRPSTMTDPLGFTTQLGYDTDDRLVSSERPDEGVAAISYDPAGDPLSLAPPGRPAYQSTYTMAGDEASMTAPPVGGAPSTNSYTYDLDRHLTLVTRPDGSTISYGYDQAARISTITYPKGPDALDGSETVTLQYDPATGNLTSVVNSNGEALSYAYDGNLLLSTTWSGTVVGGVTRSYNSDRRAISEQVADAAPTNLAYDSDGLPTAVGGLQLTHDPSNLEITDTSIGSVADHRTYDAFGGVVSYQATVGSTPVLSEQYVRDALNRITQKTETIDGTATVLSYSYDSVGRLLQVSSGGSAVASYTWDANGNRLTKTNASGTVSATYDDQDRLVSLGTLTYTYTPNGELRTKTDTSTGAVTGYKYDGLGHLREVDLATGDVVTYLVDGLGHRVAEASERERSEAVGSTQGLPIPSRKWTTMGARFHFIRTASS